jgi:hypothetical protein
MNEAFRIANDQVSSSARGRSHSHPLWNRCSQVVSRDTRKELQQVTDNFHGEQERERERESERSEREREGGRGGRVGVETWNAEKGWPVSGSFTTSFSKKVNRRIW